MKLPTKCVTGNYRDKNHEKVITGGDWVEKSKDGCFRIIVSHNGDGFDGV